MEHTFKGTRIIIEEVTGLYRVIVVMPDGIGKRDWLQFASRYNNCASLARYFYSKHIQGIVNESWLMKAEKKPIKHEPHTIAGFMDWCRLHQYETVGKFGHYDTPIARYIKETRDTWKKSSFLWDDCYQNKPRWMDRLDHFCQEQLQDDNVTGSWMLARMHDEKWDTSYYDLHQYMQRQYEI